MFWIVARPAWPGVRGGSGELIAGSGRSEHDGGGEGALVEVFERFTDRAQRVVVLAQEEARMLNHNYLGTEHILLGLIHEGEGVAAKALESLGISLEAVRQQVEKIIGQGQQAPPGHIPFTPRAKKVMELASREALQLGHNYIGTEHILLGRGKRARARLIDQALARIDALDRRLAAVEHWVGMRPDLANVDQEIAQVRREKEAAIDTQDFEAAATLRDKEKELLTARASREQEWAAASGDRPSLAAEFKQVNAELERMRAILRQRGLDTDNGAA